MPPPRFKGPVEPKHKEYLEAFSFGAAWRKRKSMDVHSNVSPSASRNASVIEGVAPDGDAAHATQSDGSADVVMAKSMSSCSTTILIW